MVYANGGKQVTLVSLEHCATTTNGATEEKKQFCYLTHLKDKSNLILLRPYDDGRHIYSLNLNDNDSI